MDTSNFDRDGFLIDPKLWDEDMARDIAAREGLGQLSKEHWQVIRHLRDHYLQTGGVPVMRHICRESGLADQCVTDLLADPTRAWRIAGLPNPGEEAKAYMDTAECHD